jgi:AMP nucleosidase
MQIYDQPEAAVDRLIAIDQQSRDNLRAALEHYIGGGELPDPAALQDGRFAYPQLRLSWDGAKFPAGRPTRAFARLSKPGVYASSIARPDMFRDFLVDQLAQLIDDYGAEISVGPSASNIPYPYVMDGSNLDLGGIGAAELSRHFPSNELSVIGDEVADGTWRTTAGAARPLALFDAPRTEFSLARLKHYTGTPADQFQHFVLFTNYTRYVDEFVRWGLSTLGDEGSPFTALSMPEALYTRDGDAVHSDDVARGPWRRYQMPAYHLMADNKSGITLVNIGVGPSNAKTICDHIAVLRPEAWLMIGHCGGLRSSQEIGDYVLAHAYLRDDHVLDDVLPPEIPLPAIAEVQQALFNAALTVTGEDEDGVKKRLRTGTVVTTDDRNWELRYTASAFRFDQSRAVAIDMESATVAAQGYRFRVPYGTLLCVSDKPLHGELKLPGQANSFYERAIGQHLQIAIEALTLLKQEGEGLHSRKLRSFDEPPLR